MTWLVAFLAAMGFLLLVVQGLNQTNRHTKNSFRIGRDAHPSSLPAKEPQASRPCSCHEGEICDEGFPSWVLWNRAQMLANQYRDYSGYDQARENWEAHLKGTVR